MAEKVAAKNYVLHRNLQVRPYLGTLSKAKAAKLVRQLVDLFLDMESAVGLEVDLCKVSFHQIFPSKIRSEQFVI